MSTDENKALVRRFYAEIDNGNLAANATTSFGFNGTWDATNAVPTLSCTTT